MTVLTVAGEPKPGLDAGLVDRAQGLSTALLSDAMERLPGAVGISPVSGLAPGQVVAGPAFTVSTRPGDNLAIHAALDLVRPGELLVVAAGGGMDRAVIGGLMGRYASMRGVAAIVVDGAVRDREDLEHTAPPVFARGFNHLGPYKSGPGELRGCVVVGGLRVHDGDLVVGDADGITVIARAEVPRVLAEAEAVRDGEAQAIAAIATGTWHRPWLDGAFAAPDADRP
jgi:regulator of RNase E activity RraA